MAVRPRSIFVKGLLLVALPVAFQLLTAAIILRVNAGATEAEREAERSTEALQRAEEISHIIFEGHSALRGMVLHQDVSFDRRERERLAGVPRLLAELQAFLRYDAQVEATKLIGATSERYLAWVAAQETRARGEQWVELQAEFRRRAGKGLVDDVLASINAFIDVQREIDTARAHSAAAQRIAVQRWLLVFTAGLVPLAVGVAWLFSTNIAGRLAVVSRNAQRMADSLPMAGEVGGADEIAELDRVLHATDRRLAENRERERHDAQELSRRATELVNVNRVLESRTRENEVFVYSASHDLRSPLVNLQGFTQEIARGCDALHEALARPEIPSSVRAEVDGILREDIASSLGYIQAAVMRLSGIIDALLRLSRAGRLEYARVPVELGPIVDRILRALGDSIAQRGAEVRVGALPEVVGDPTAIEQVLANLLGNAVTYLDPARPGLIEVGTADNSEPGGTRTVFVRDNGLGIPATHQTKLFLPFQRLHESVAPGEGVGLALAWRMVERLGGRLWVESTEGVGSTFYLSLPGDAAGSDTLSGRAPA